MIHTKAVFFLAEPPLHSLLPPSIRLPASPAALGGIRWDLLALNHAGCRALLAERITCACSTLLIPGDTAAPAAQLIQADRVISAGLSPFSSITFSSLTPEQTLVCIQRTLQRIDGSLLEPQEMPFSALPCSPEDQLLVFGLHLLL